MRARTVPRADDNRPLSDSEEALLARLFSDPTKFPMAFKTWMISWLEGSDLTLPMSSITGLSSRLGITGTAGSVAGLPAGLVMVNAALLVPAGALLCDGASYLRTDKARLFSAIGATFGSVDAAHFNVPTLAAPGAGMVYIIVA